MYISVGHKISLDVTTLLVVACSHKRIPEPTRKVSIRVLIHYLKFINLFRPISCLEKIYVNPLNLRKRENNYIQLYIIIIIYNYILYYFLKCELVALSLWVIWKYELLKYHKQFPVFQLKKKECDIPDKDFEGYPLYVYHCGFTPKMHRYRDEVWQPRPARCAVILNVTFQTFCGVLPCWASCCKINRIANNSRGAVLGASWDSGMVTNCCYDVICCFWRRGSILWKQTLRTWKINVSLLETRKCSIMICCEWHGVDVLCLSQCN